MEPEREDVVKGSLFRIAFSTISQCSLLFTKEEDSVDPNNSSRCVEITLNARFTGRSGGNGLGTVN